jgi:hypothetical protein
MMMRIQLPRKIVRLVSSALVGLVLFALICTGCGSAKQVNRAFDGSTCAHPIFGNATAGERIATMDECKLVTGTGVPTEVIGFGRSDLGAGEPPQAQFCTTDAAGAIIDPPSAWKRYGYIRFLVFPTERAAVKCSRQAGLWVSRVVLRPHLPIAVAPNGLRTGIVYRFYSAQTTQPMLDTSSGSSITYLHASELDLASALKLPH